MEIRKRLLGAFNFAKNIKSMTSDSVAKAPEPPKGDKLEKETNLFLYTYFVLADFRSKGELGTEKG